MINNIKRQFQLYIKSLKECSSIESQFGMVAGSFTGSLFMTFALSQSIMYFLGIWIISMIISPFIVAFVYYLLDKFDL
jgi:hypothetical protein